MAVRRQFSMHERRAPARTARWFHYALVGTFCVAGFAMLMLILGAILLPPVIQSTVEKYTATEPAPIPTASLPEAEREALEKRVDVFGDAVKDNLPVEPLILSETDLNTLLQDVWKDEELPGAMALRIEDGRIKSDISIPLKPGMSVGPFSPDLAGRYVNGTVTFRVALVDGVLGAEIESFLVNGKAVPRWIIDALDREFLEGEILKNKDLVDFAKNLQRIDVRADRVLLEARSP